MGDARSTARRLFEHCFGDQEPTLPLLRTGQFPAGWAETYLRLAQQVATEIAGSVEWPRELIAAAYLASVYCEKRYNDWCGGGGANNPETEVVLRQIRWTGDSLIMGWAWEGRDKRK